MYNFFIFLFYFVGCKSYVQCTVPLLRRGTAPFVTVVWDIGVGGGVGGGHPYHIICLKNPIRVVGTSVPSGLTPRPLLGQCPNFCSFYLLKASLTWPVAYVPWQLFPNTKSSMNLWFLNFLDLSCLYP